MLIVKTGRYEHGAEVGQRVIPKDLHLQCKDNVEHLSGYALGEGGSLTGIMAAGPRSVEPRWGLEDDSEQEDNVEETDHSFQCRDTH